FRQRDALEEHPPDVADAERTGAFDPEYREEEAYQLCRQEVAVEKIVPDLRIGEPGKPLHAGKAVIELRVLDQNLGDRRAPVIAGKHAGKALGETDVVDEGLELLVRIDDPLAAALLAVVDRVIPEVLPGLRPTLVEAQRPGVI